MLFHFYWVFAWLRFIHGRSRGPPFLIHQGLSFLTKSDQILSFTTKWDQGEAQSSSLSPVLSAIVGWTPPLGWNKIFETYSILQILVFFAKRIYFQKDHLWSLGWAKEVHKSSSPCGAPWVPARMIIRDVRSSSRTILSTMKPIYECNIYAIKPLHLEGGKSKSSFCVLREGSQFVTRLRSFITI